MKLLSDNRANQKTALLFARRGFKRTTISYYDYGIERHTIINNDGNVRTSYLPIETYKTQLRTTIENNKKAWSFEYTQTDYNGKTLLNPIMFIPKAKHGISLNDDNEIVRKCYKCSEEIKPDDNTCLLHEEELYCESCFNDVFSVCAKCNNTVHSDDMRYSEIASACYCEACYNDKFCKCDQCDTELEINGEDHIAHNGDNYCHDCLTINFTYCENCDDYFPRDDVRYSEQDEGYYCEDCYTESVSCNFMTSDTFEKTQGIERYFSIELECIADNEKHIGEYPVGTDGTIDGNGVEYRIGILQGDKGLYSMTKFVDRVAEDHTVNESCGAHVHIDARDLTTKQITKVFAYTRSYENIIDKFLAEGRLGSAYTQRINIYDYETLKQNYDNGTLPSLDRYVGCNLQSVSVHGTIEFRYLQGTLDSTLLKHWCLFLLKLVEHAKDLDELPKHKKFTNIENFNKLMYSLELPGDTQAYLKDLFCSRTGITNVEKVEA